MRASSGLRSGGVSGRLVGEGASPVDVETVPGSTEIGYVVRGNLAQLVARTAIEVDFGAGYKKRYWVEADLPG